MASVDSGRSVCKNLSLSKQSASNLKVCNWPSQVVLTYQTKFKKLALRLQLSAEENMYSYVNVT